MCPSAEYPCSQLIYDSGRGHFVLRLLCVVLGSAFLVQDVDLLAYIISGRSFLVEVVGGRYPHSTIPNILFLFPLTFFSVMLLSAWVGRRVIALEPELVVVGDCWFLKTWWTAAE